jgi:hypothetical protein
MTVELLFVPLLALIVAIALIHRDSTAQRRMSTAHHEENNQLFAQIESRLNRNANSTATVKGDLNKLRGLLGDAAIDVGFHRDCGWLILACRVNGQDRVQIQHIRPDLSPQDYRTLVEVLTAAGSHLAFLDMPFGSGYEQFFRRPRRTRGNQPW